MMPPPLLVTGFEPFGGDADNPSWRVAEALAGSAIDGVPVVAERLPCVFGAALAALDAAIARHAPLCVLGLGQAAGRSNLSLERIAINVDDARIADNAGQWPIDEPVVAGAPAAYFSTLPIKAAVAALHAAGLPASVSHSAGTYVCNHVFYGLMHRLRDTPSVHGGFMHLPLLPGQAAQRPVGAPSMALAQQIDGVRIVLQATLRWRHRGDLRAGGGTIA